jgi:glucokinase
VRRLWPLPGPSARIDRFTNNPWVIYPGQLRETAGRRCRHAVNDFGAVGHAVAHAGEEHFSTSPAPTSPCPPMARSASWARAPALAWRNVARRNGFYHVQATEGGHIDFAPLDAIEDALLAACAKRHRRVSVERVVSGPAIVDIYETLAALEGGPSPA